MLLRLQPSNTLIEDKREINILLHQPSKDEGGEPFSFQVQNTNFPS